MPTTNELKKGTRVKLANGWEAILADNRKGNIRLAQVFGIYTEYGSVYAHDIVKAQVNGEWVEVEHTAKQKSCKELNESLFG